MRKGDIKIGERYLARLSSRNLVRPWTDEDDRAIETRAEARLREESVIERLKAIDPVARIHNGRVLLSVDAVDSLLGAE